MQLYICFCSDQIKISDVPKRVALFPNRVSQISCVPELDTQTCRKMLILNLNNFFLGNLKKKSERSKVKQFVHL